MTALVLCGQDIHHLDLGNVRDGHLVQERRVSALPEAYLSAVDASLQEWKIVLDEVDAIAVVNGPGSFTALRVSTTIGNALAFTRNISVFSVENPDREPLSRVVARIDWSASGESIIPAYDKPPHITLPRPR